MSSESGSKMDIDNMIGIVAGSITIGAGIVGGVLWLVASKLAPMERAMVGYVEKFEAIVANNTKALERIETVITRHDDVLDDHADRITRLETTHSVLGCSERRAV